MNGKIAKFNYEFLYDAIKNKNHEGRGNTPDKFSFFLLYFSSIIPMLDISEEPIYDIRVSVKNQYSCSLYKCH